MADHREVRIPTHTLPATTARTWPPQRSFGCMWHHDKQAVTILLFPDHGDAVRALATMTPDAADCLADELRRCAAWTRDYANGFNRAASDPTPSASQERSDG